MAKRTPRTTIYVGNETMYAHPHSLLPPNFFDRVIAIKKKRDHAAAAMEKAATAPGEQLQRDTVRRSVLTIESWDGKRQVMEVMLSPGGGE